MFEDLVHGLRLLHLNNPQITKPQLYVLMKALENGNLKLNYLQQVRHFLNLFSLLAIASLLNISWLYFLLLVRESRQCNLHGNL